MRSDFITYIDIGNGWTQFYPDNVEPPKDIREPNQYFKRYGWSKVSIRNNPDLYAVASDDIYKLYDILTSKFTPSFATEPLDPTDEVKIWYHTDNYDIYGYFGLNDCAPDDDRGMLTVKPTVQDNYTDLLENWETKIDFDDMVYDTDEIDLNIEALGTKSIPDWTEVENKSVRVYNPFTGAFFTVVVQDWAPNKKVGLTQWAALGGLSGFFDGEAPNELLWSVPETNFQDYEGFYLPDRQEILGEDFSAFVAEAWLSIDTYGVFDTSQLTSDVVLYGGVTYKSIQAANLNKQPDVNPLWWEEIYVGEVYPQKGDYELSEVTFWDGGQGGRKAHKYRKLYCTTRFSRDEFRKIDVVSLTHESGFVPPSGDGWNMRSKEKVQGEDGHLWTRIPFNGGFSTSWILQDEITNPSGLSNNFSWYAKQTSKIAYPDSANSKTISVTMLPRDFLEYILQNTNSVFASSNVKSTFFFNDDEADLPILADRIGEGYNYVTMAENYLNQMRMFFTRDLIPDLDPADTSTFPEVTLKKTIEDLNKVFNNNLYFYVDDSLDLHIEHIKYLDLTMQAVDLRGKAELDFTESWKYNKSRMFNRIELRQMNASGVDFTDNLIIFPKIVSNKRNVDIRLQIETEMFSTDLRYAVENSSDLENGVIIITTENKETPTIRPQIDDLLLTGTTGEATNTAGGVSGTMTIDVKLVLSIEQFILDYAAVYLSVGIVLTLDVGKLIFTKNGAFTNVTFNNISGDIAGTPVVVQTYALLSTDTSIVVRNKAGLVSGVNEANGYMALSNLLYDYGRYEGVWESGTMNGVANTPFETTSRTKNGKEILLKGIFDSLFFITELGIGLLSDSTPDFDEENTKLNLSYRYNSVPDTDRFVLMAQKEDEFVGAVDKWLDIGNYET